MDIREARQQVGRVARSGVVDGDYFPLAGGLNTDDSPLTIAPGELLDGVNYEPRTLGGYQRLQGYERLDGHIAPSQAPYYILAFNSGTPAHYPSVGTVIKDASSSTFGTILVPLVLDNTGLAGYAVIGSLQGASLPIVVGGAGHVLQQPSSGAFNWGVSTGAAVIYGQSGNPTLDAAYRVAAREAARALIQKVPGTGPVRGVVEYNGTVYAFRDNAGGTEGFMYKAVGTGSANNSGWEQLGPNQTLAFTAGSLQVNVGDQIEQLATASLAVVLRIVLESGDYAAGTAAGLFVLAIGASSGFTNGGTLIDTTQAGATVGTISGTVQTPTLLPGGTYDFRIQNFFGSTGSIRLYGCDGVNPAFEFQDTAGPTAPFAGYFMQIASGMPVDTPKRLECHRGRLWLGFPGGSVQPSGINDPVVFSALQGAAELGVGYEITAMLGEMSPSQSAFYSTATLFIFTPEQIFTITGDGPNWILGPYAVDTGGSAFSVQRLGQGIFINERGFAILQAVQQLGNFALASVSLKIQSLIAGILANAVCSSISKNRSLYRLFMSDGRYVAIGFKDLKITGITLCDLSQAMSCAWAGNTLSGAELLLAGGTNGYVYQLDSGIQIDGGQLNAFLHTAFHFSKTPSRQKRYRRAQLDLFANGQCTLQFAPDYSFGQAGADAPRTLASVGSAPNPGEYANFSWSNGTVASPTFKLEGSGTNVGFVLLHQSTNENPHVIQGITLHKSMRRLDRGSQT